jgi:polysaccharide pyruvyl transferase WcaK-like protein
MPTALLLGCPEPLDPGERALRSAIADALPGWTLREVRDTRDRRWAASAGEVAGGSLRDLTRAIRDSQLLIVAGDAPRGSRHDAAALWMALAAAASGRRRLVLLGLRARERDSLSGRLLAAALTRVAVLSFTGDRSTARTLSAAGAPSLLRVGADPAWTAVARDAPALKLAPEPHNPRVIVALDRRAAGKDPGLRLTAALRRLAGGSGAEIELQPWIVREGESDDVSVAQALAVALGPPARVGLGPRELGEARDVYAEADLVVANGHRTLIAAAAAGTRAVALSDDPATRELAGELGLAAVPTDSVEEMTTAATRALSSPPAPRDRVEAAIARAEEGARLLRVVASEGRDPEADVVGGLALAEDER